MNGTPVTVLRQATPDDQAAIAEFVCALSPRSQYLRFFAYVAPPSSGLLRALTDTDRADVLLVTDRRGNIIGHGMAADIAAGQGLESSIGLVVADAWQRQGVGGQLLDSLAARASRRGVSALVLEVLPANRVMLGIIARRWPDTPSERTPDAMVFRPAVSQADGCWRLPRVVRISQRGDEGDQGARDRSAA
jgi:ribosomal protein S18 acetylase RimI-like enzyme